MRPTVTVALLATLVGIGCGGESARPSHSSGTSSHATPDVTPGPGVSPGLYAGALIGALRNPVEGDTRAIVDGRRYFNAFNCSGCHSGYAGGGMGPNLRDTTWIYGSSDADLYSTIAEGRPAGMPAWGGRIPEAQIWEIIAYLRTLGTAGEPVKPPTPTRTTAMVATPQGPP
jgi:cytochrome c oxidase cbb3-type subunit 3